MPKILKLTGCDTYLLAPLGGEPIKKGEVVEFDDDLAEIVQKDVKVNGDNEEVPFFTEQPEGTAVDYKIGKGTVEAVAAAPSVTEGVVVTRVSQRPAKVVQRKPKAE